MKIISYCVVALILVGLSISSSTENTVSSGSATEIQSNLNSGIFESISKYKLKTKGKAKGKSTSKAKANTSTSSNKSKEATSTTANTATSGLVPTGMAAPLPAGGVNLINDKNSAKGNSSMSLKAGPNLWQGWAKFYVYKTSDEKSLLKGTQKVKFYKNYDYYEQFKQNPDLNINEVVDKEFKYIHDPYSFYVTLFPNNINFSNSRIVSKISI